MTDTQTLIREKTEYVKLEGGRWQAAFPGNRWNLVVTAPTARARALGPPLDLR